MRVFDACRQPPRQLVEGLSEHSSTNLVLEAFQDGRIARDEAVWVIAYELADEAITWQQYESALFIIRAWAEAASQ